MATIIETQATPTPAADQLTGWHRIGKVVRTRLAALVAGIGWLGLYLARAVSNLDVRVVNALTIAAGSTLLIAMLSGRTDIAAVAAPLTVCGSMWIAGYRRGCHVAQCEEESTWETAESREH